ncbi:Hemin-binding periplasmic protein HmuT precursor [compost metagenome]
MNHSLKRLAAAVPALLALSLVTAPLTPAAWAQSAGTQLEDASGRKVQIRDAKRVVTLSGGVTEIVYALKAGSRVVGTDITSMYPREAIRLPKIGQDRRISAEGVIALNPSLVIAPKDAEPSSALNQLRAMGVSVLLVSDEQSLSGARDRIQLISRALGVEAEGKKLLATLNRQTMEAQAISAPSRPLKVLFIYARGAGSLNVAGKDTAAHAMLTLAGAQNAVTEFTGYKPFTAEATIKASPDIVMITESGAKSLGGADAIFKLPGLAQTPAGAMKRVIAMDDLLLLSFGPRTGLALTELRHELYSAQKAPKTAKP